MGVPFTLAAAAILADVPAAGVLAELHATSVSAQTAPASRILNLINIVAFPFKDDCSKTATAENRIFYQFEIARFRKCSR
jgi:hypothetical protein